MKKKSNFFSENDPGTRALQRGVSFGDAKNKALHAKMGKKASPEMLSRAKAFEHEQNKALKAHLANRRKNIKSGGFKNEHDYFTNVNPFTGKRRGS